MQKYQDIDYALARILYDSVVQRCFNLSYKECADSLALKVGRNVNAHFNLSIPLCHVAEMCYELGLPLITAIVRYSNAKTAKQIGEGFYSMACDYHSEYKAIEPADAWRIELNSVRQCRDWSRLDAFLSLVEGEDHFIDQRLST